MNIYLNTENDEFLIDLREWCESNTLTEDDLIQHESFKQFQVEKARKDALLRNSTILKCSKCGKETNVGNYNRWHGDNCGKVTHHKEETKNKISATLSGRDFSEEHRKKLGEANTKRKGYSWWNNGFGLTKLSRFCPGEGWVRGRLVK